MSYSFTVRAKDRNDARQVIVNRFDEVIKSQPIHARDREGVIKGVKALVDLIAIPEGHVLSITCNGSVGWNGKGDDITQADITGANLNISVECVKPLSPEARQPLPQRDPEPEPHPGDAHAEGAILTTGVGKADTSDLKVDFTEKQ
jgi:hypothetical protein